MQMGKTTVLVASRDRNLAEQRRNILELSGYKVISVFHAEEVDAACNENHIEAVVIGYSVEPSEKRRIWSRVKEGCGDSRPPILELSAGGPPILIDSHLHQFANATDFVSALEKILHPH